VRTAIVLVPAIIIKRTASVQRIGARGEAAAPFAARGHTVISIEIGTDENKNDIEYRSRLRRVGGR
jgi:hypothetical protein